MKTTLTDFHQSFIEKDILLLHFSELSPAQATTVLAWRNHPDIRKWMYNKAIISEEEHRRFLENLPNQQQQSYWMVKEGAHFIGVIDLSKFQYDESEWGFYLNPAFIGSGKAIHLFYYALYFFFSKLRLRKLFGFVNYLNTSSLLLNEFFGFQLKSLLPRANERGSEWYAHYELLAEDYLAREMDLRAIKRSLLLKDGPLQLKRKEIAAWQLYLKKLD